MKQRLVGGESVGEIGLGCMGMSHAYGPSDEGESLKVLDHAIELGCNFWDTADFYGAGRNEILVQKALVKHRSKVFLATKVGNVFDRSLTSHQDQVEAQSLWIVDGTAEYIRKCCDLSLQRLGVDCIDLYYLHRVDPLVPIEESVGAMAELVKLGKVRYVGLSEASPETMKRAMKVHPITALQTEYSLWSRDVEGEILPACRELGITFVPYSPLGRGFLTGEVKDVDELASDDWRRSLPRFQGENFQANLELLKTIRWIAEHHEATPAQVALAWVLSKGQDIIPIPGTKRIKYLEQNIDAGKISLSDEEIKELENLQAAGERFPEFLRRYVNG
ncbi:MAG TPA: aldo/keto reductase [Syntrophomonadaceae bacterium]|nr:aldo/keto reductase [Syntrophomonadaceae bacterium]